MKSFRVRLLPVLMSLSTIIFAQTDTPKSDTPKSNAQESFDQLKTLAGSWQASITTDPPLHEMGNGTMSQVSLRVTSRGNALVHEVEEVGKTEEQTRCEHP